MSSSVPSGLASDRLIARPALDRLLAAENERYGERRPLASARSSRNSKGGFAGGVPMHWMRDWPQPFPMIIDTAHGNRLRDIDGNEVVDFCLGDTGAMFGHAPAPVMQAMRRQESRGLTYMLPSAEADRVGELLQERFGLPCWQVAVTASDANRFALRAARTAAGRRANPGFRWLLPRHRRGYAGRPCRWKDGGATQPSWPGAGSEFDDGDDPLQRQVSPGG